MLLEGGMNGSVDARGGYSLSVELKAAQAIEQTYKVQVMRILKEAVIKFCDKGLNKSLIFDIRPDLTLQNGHAALQTMRVLQSTIN